ncbi:MAG: hypothetical protein ACRD44_07335 [Bryobacteraceae bacterium]
MRGDPVRTLLCALVAALSIAGSLDFYRWIARYNLEDHPPRIDWPREERRFRAIADVVPPNARIGYVSPLPLAELWASEAFQTARYLLAPRMLIAGPKAVDQGWLLVARGEPGACRVVREFGDLALCQR